MAQIRPEKREVTGSTPVPTTESVLARAYVSWTWRRLIGDGPL
jgi:hypothetical protein